MFPPLTRFLARYLQKEIPGYKPVSKIGTEKLRQVLQPGDILLVEGNRRISVAIKYLTQSTWSHAAVYVGPMEGHEDDDDPPCLIEADVLEGVIMVPLSKYAHLSTRICRAERLDDKDRDALIAFLKGKLGEQYDTRNAFDLFRFLLPEPPIPMRWRRRMLALGSGDPTRAICSTLIAQAYHSIRYPILPEIKEGEVYDMATGTSTTEEIMHIRHYSLFAPRDFDISPYFRVIKPTLENGFDYKAVRWAKK